MTSTDHSSSVSALTQLFENDPEDQRAVPGETVLRTRLRAAATPSNPFGRTSPISSDSVLS